MDNWLLPITIIPGIGMIIMSTSGISNALSAEISNVLNRNMDSDRPIVDRKIHQLWVLSISLMLQYISAACLAISGLLGGLKLDQFGVVICTEILLFTGVGFIVIALLYLILYARRAVKIKRDQFTYKN